MRWSIRLSASSPLTTTLALVVVTAAIGFPETPRTPTDLIGQVFNALERRDERTLKALAITRSDFKKFIWPSLSQTVIGRLGINADTLYLVSVKESGTGLALTSKEYGGRKLSLIQISPLTGERRPIHRKRRFSAYAGPVVTMRDENGNERTVQVVGGVVEIGGVYKVSTYSLAPDQK